MLAPLIGSLKASSVRCKVVHRKCAPWRTPPAGWQLRSGPAGVLPPEACHPLTLHLWQVDRH